MRRVHTRIPILLVPLGLTALLLALVCGRLPDRAAALTAPPVQPPASRSASVATRVADVAPAAPPAAAAFATPPEAGRAAQSDATPPPGDDPDALAAWFRDQVMQAYERDEAGAGHGGTRSSTATRRPVRIARAQPSAQGGALADGHRIDWAYLEDVFSGRVSGIPDERRAGISLQEMDRIGGVPYVEELRQEKRYDELRDLGFENETTPWPMCIRLGVCRRDRASSPP